MNKSAINNFAISARKKLIEQVMQKAFQIGITAKSITDLKQEAGHIILNNIPQEKGFKFQRNKLIQEIEQKGYDQVMEEVAYTWFNRFIALRFMEINDYLPTGVRVLSSLDPNRVEPDIIREALNVDLAIDKNVIYDFQDKNDSEGLFKYLLIHQCNELNAILPFMFETIADYTELLFPSNLLQEGSVIRDMVTSIPVEDWKEVEIIGWLYQYYISEKKDEVIQAKKRYKKEEIPFATQLFTPKWIVRYMVQNSLGRYWVESHPEQSAIKKNWEFYLDNPNTEKEFEEELKPYLNRELQVEDIKVYDPACGSGNILVYVFDVLYEIYQKCGYLEEDIPRLIIEKNLYGLDIDDRAYQLACFSVVMKATRAQTSFLNLIKNEKVKLNIISIQESNLLKDNEIEYLAGEKQGQIYNTVKSFIDLFRDAKVYGSLIKIEDYNKEIVWGRFKDISRTPADDVFLNESRERLIRLIPNLVLQADIMNGVYDVLITNPPYMGNRYMCSNLAEFARINFPETKSDLFSAFLEYCPTKVHKKGHLGFVTPFVWMFISSYENLRKSIIENNTFSTFLQLEYNAFEAACVPVCTFTTRNYSINIPGEFVRLSDFTGIENQPIKTLEAIENPNVYYRYTSISSEFNRMTGSPIAYWVSEKVKKIYEKGIQLGDIAAPRKGNSTSDNNRFLRLWYEVDISKENFGKKEIFIEETIEKRWFPYNKGGGYRKWYGFNEYMIDWKNDAHEIRKIPTAVIANYQYFMKPGLTWSTITSNKFSIRAFGYGYIFDNGGCCLFTDDEFKLYYLSLLNSKVFEYIFAKTNPTLNFQSGEVAKFPVIKNNEYLTRVNNISQENIEISRADWDNFETSWDFRQHPLLKHKGIQSEKNFNAWYSFAEDSFYKLKANEEELNRIFIEIYGLQDELTPEVEDKDIANESSRECIRRYFLKDFYKDHVQIYKKRPIYWLFSSGKEQAFNALIYMHRYDSSMVSRVRTDYLHPLQNKLEAEFMRLNQVLVSEDSPTEKTKATKRLKVLTKQMDELKKYDEVIHNLADQQIEIDLDDGVVVNYAKFEKVLAKI